MTETKEIVHLHNHSNHSFLDGQSSVKDMVARAKELELDAIAITNHGNIFAHVEFYKECKKAGIKPILGSEFYLVFDHEESVDAKARHAHHLVVLAENETGWYNLCRLTTIANRQFYYKPRIDMKALEKHREGLIVLTACMHGPVSYWLFDKMTWPKDGEESQLKEAANIPEAYRFARALNRALKPGQLFLEVQDGGIPEQILINKRVRQMAGELGLSTVATQDAHYVMQDDADAHSFLKAMAFGKSAVEAGSHGFSTKEFYIKNREQVLEGDILEEEVDRTREIAARCNVDLPLHQIRLPQYPGLPEGESSVDFLKKKVNDCWKKRGIKDESGYYKARVQREMSDIEEAGLADYFLIVSDITDFCHDNDIMLGPARGSAGGSLVSYLLGITTLDPIKYGLMWERFYNAGRAGSMPDIDTDVEKSRRDEVIAYIKSRFGDDRVAQLVTLSSLGAKGVLKDVFRVAGIDVDTQNRISGLVPAKNDDHVSVTLDEACQMVPELNKYAVDTDEFEIKRGGRVIRQTSWSELFDIAKRLEGCYKTTGVHAAAVVIADKDFDDAGIPLVKGATKDDLICGWDMDAVDEFGLLKVDILGLATLSVIKTTLRLIKERHGLDIDIQNIPLDDPNVVELIGSGRNEGVFQIESQLGKSWSKKCKPGSLDPSHVVEEIAELVAIIRPACLETGMAGSYANIKKGEETPTYIHPLLEPILSPTKGILLYQEQVMAICQDVAGMDLKEADKVRKTIGKKKPEELKLKKEQFMAGAKATVPDEVAEEIWGWIERQAGYGFNKSHAVGYAMLAYQTAWLKANYYIEFLCANLIHAKDKANQQRTPLDVIALFINDGKLHDITVVPPHISRSDNDFTIIDDETISFGFSHIKSVGAASMKAVQICQQAKSFEDFVALARDGKMKSNVVEALISAGVLDCFKTPRRAMRNRFRLLEELTAKERAAIPTDGDIVDEISSLAAEENVDERKAQKLFVPNVKRREKIRGLVASFLKLEHQDSMAQLLTWEKDYLGATISGSLADLKHAMQARNTCIEIGRGAIRPRQQVDLCVVVEAMREHTIKTGNNAGQVMLFLTLSDSTYRLDNVCMFSEAYARIKGSVEVGDVVSLRGVMSDRGLIANSIRRL